MTTRRQFNRDVGMPSALCILMGLAALMGGCGGDDTNGGSVATTTGAGGAASSASSASSAISSTSSSGEGGMGAMGGMGGMGDGCKISVSQITISWLTYRC